MGEYRNNSQMNAKKSPLPVMPSQTFFDLAHSQFELLTNALVYSNIGATEPKIKSIALYLPQENDKTGQLEFLPSLVYPTHPKSERVFIASDSNSRLPPSVPSTLTQLPGFAHAQTIIPSYPFASVSTSTNGKSCIGVGTPEEVFCDRRSGEGSPYIALSLPLFSGAETIGVLLIWGQKHFSYESIFNDSDILQIKRAGETIAMALSMDADRIQTKIRNEEFRFAVADNLHQVKNPVQALRTFTKLLKRNMVIHGNGDSEVAHLIDVMLEQSNRIADNLKPIDAMIDTLEKATQSVSYQNLLSPMKETKTNLLINQGEDDFGSRTDDNDRIQITFLTDILKPIISTFQVIADDSGIDFCIYGMDNDHDLPGVMIKSHALQEAITNILDNAMKYVVLGRDGIWGVENTKPLVRMHLRPNSEKFARGVTIIIEDNGPGISFEDMEVVFDRGFRGAYARNVSIGSGIGLDYSRTMIEQMGGSLSILYQPEGGYLEGTIVQCVLYRKLPNNQKKIIVN